MARIAVVGAQGYVGRALTAVLEKSGHDVTAVTRENYAEHRAGSYDIVVNSAMPSARFWAKQNPAADFRETVEKTADLVYGWNFGKFIQISTVSARCQLDTVYGRHKAAAEKICEFGNNLIVRLGSMYSQDLAKGVLVDILRGDKVFVHGKSRYSFTPLEFVAQWLASNLDRQGIVEVGAKNTIALEDIADHLGAMIEFEGNLDHQEIQNPEPDFPDARDVLAFMSRMRDNPNNPQ